MTRLLVALDGSHADQVRVVADMDGVSRGDTIVRALEEYLVPSGSRDVSVELSEDLTGRAAAAAATRGLTLEQLVAEAVDAVRSPKMTSRVEWLPALGFGLVLTALPLLILSLSPHIHNRSPSSISWVLFGVAMAVAVFYAGNIAWLLSGREFEMAWRLGPWFVGAIVISDITIFISGFAYLYWMLSNVLPGFFYKPMSKVDALYFTLNTFATTGTGTVTPRSGGAESLVSLQVVLDFIIVAVALVMLLSRGFTLYRKRRERGVVVHRWRDSVPRSFS